MIWEQENRLLILNAQGVLRLLHLLTSNAGQELKRCAPPSGAHLIQPTATQSSHAVVSHGHLLPECRSAVLGLLNLASVEPVRKELRDGRGFQHVAWLMQSVTPNTQTPEVLLEVRASVLIRVMVGMEAPAPVAASKP